MWQQQDGGPPVMHISLPGWLSGRLESVQQSCLAVGVHSFELVFPFRAAGSWLAITEQHRFVDGVWV